MKHIYFEYRHNSPVIVSDETYEVILSLIAEERICRTCHHKFTEKNPMVSLNLCLLCFMKEHQYFTFLDEIREAEGIHYYAFLDTDGILETTSTISENVTRDIYMTLKFWNFPVPQTYTPAGHEYILYPFYWKVYGDVRAPACVIEYDEQYGVTPTVAYLVDKQGGVLLLNKRKKSIQKLFAAAHACLSTYKRSDGLYVLPNGHEQYWIGASDEYETIAAQASKRLEAQTGERP